MTVRLLLAASLAALTQLGGLPTSAADLGGYGGKAYDSKPYDDRRYRDIYRHPRPPAPAPAPAIEPEGYRSPPLSTPPHDDRGFLRPMPPSYQFLPTDDRRWVERYDRGYHELACLPRRKIRQRLVRYGWRRLQDVEIHRDVVLVRARRRGGWYDLTLDRCRGHVLQAHLVDRAHARAPSWRHYRRWQDF